MSLKKPMGRPSRAETDRLRNGQEHDMRALQDACVLALIQGTGKVRIKMSRLTEMPEGFPKGIVKLDTGLERVLEYNAKKVMRWLERTGKATVTIEDVARAQLSYLGYTQYLGREYGL